MKKAKVLVIGAGAMGSVVGLHLEAGGADISFLVRPARSAALGATMRFWDHGAAVVRELDRFSVVTNVGAAADHDVVLVTLDGAALASPDGRRLLAGLGDALRDRDAVLVVGAVGLRVRAYVVAITGLPAERVVQGALGMLSYAIPAVSFASSAPAREARADFGFRYLAPSAFMVAPSTPASRRFAELFDASAIASCAVMSEEELSLANVSLFPLFVAAELSGWPADLAQDAALWSCSVASVREIQRLPLHGSAGASAAEATTGESLLGTWAWLAAACAPLDWTEFSRYHHGAKVWSSDLLVLEACVQEGAREGRAMPATSELLARGRG